MSELTNITKSKLKQVKNDFYDFVLKHILDDAFVTMYLNDKRLSEFGLTGHPKNSYYNPMPQLAELEKTKNRWNRPSSLAGIDIDLKLMEQKISELTTNYFGEFKNHPTYEEVLKLKVGAGCPELDVMVLYLMMRKHKPKRYLEIGCGISTYYASLAAKMNAKEGKPVDITCIDIVINPSLGAMPGIKFIKEEGQNVNLDVFRELEAGDILFIDSTHTVKIDGEVPYLFLEVLPILKKGVIVHIHDIAFPYNIPYPAETWILNVGWPMYWTEAMLIQAFLAFNKSYEILLSVPYIRFHDEKFLVKTIPDYKKRSPSKDPSSSLWIART